MTRTTPRVRRGLLGTAALAGLLGLHPPLRAEPADPNSDSASEAPADAGEAIWAEATAPEAPPQADRAPAREPRKAIEEITVTARRREEALQSTPLSVTAFSETELESRGVQSVTEISQSTPSLQFDSTAGSNSNARIFIRGVGQGDPIFTADPGVGLYVDGVSYTRAAGSIFDLVDIERIEVLRGPQGALYGKSTIGGAINILTKKPDGDTEGNFRVAVGEDHRRDARASIGFPLIGETLFGRLALSTRNTDGFARDTFTNKDLQDEGKFAARGRMRWIATDNLEFTVTGERNYNREESIAFKLREVDDENGFVAVGNLLGDDFGAGLLIDDPFKVATDTPSRNDLDTYGLALNTDYSFGDTFLGTDTRLELITAWRKIDQKVNFDVDGTASGGVNQFVSGEQRQFSQEIRLLGSAFNDKFTWGMAAFYFREDGKDEQRTELFSRGSLAVRDTRLVVRCKTTTDLDGAAAIFQDPNTTQQQQSDIIGKVAETIFQDLATIILSGNITQTAADCGAVNPQNVERLLTGAMTTNAQPGQDPRRLLATALLAVPDDNVVSTNNQILNTNYATYAFGTYQLTDAVSLTVAGRYNYEVKDLFRNQLLVPSGQAVIDNASVDQTFRDFSPEASLSWQITDDQLGYFRAARGFKSGGFNGRAQRIRQGGVSSEEAKGLLRPYDAETLTSFELGYKSSWFDRRFIFNSTFFYNLYDDIQQQRLGQDETGQLTSIIDNAAQAIIQGFELEMTALLPTQTTISANASVTSARFTSFPGAIPNPAFDPMNASFGPRSFDGSDLHLTNVPLFTANASISQDFELPWGTLTPRLDYFMRTRAFNDVLNTDATRSNKFGVFNARVAFTPDGDRWGIALVCRNLFDREYLVNGVDLIDAFGFASGQFGPPRDFYIEATYKF